MTAAAARCPWRKPQRHGGHGIERTAKLDMLNAPPLLRGGHVKKRHISMSRRTEKPGLQFDLVAIAVTLASVAVFLAVLRAGGTSAALRVLVLLGIAYPLILFVRRCGPLALVVFPMALVAVWFFTVVPEARQVQGCSRLGLVFSYVFLSLAWLVLAATVSAVRMATGGWHAYLAPLLVNAAAASFFLWILFRR